MSEKSGLTVCVGRPQAYGEVLFRAWRTAAGPCLLELEYGCMQGLLKACLLATTPQMALALRSVLDGFHSQKNVKVCQK